MYIFQQDGYNKFLAIESSPPPPPHAESHSIHPSDIMQILFSFFIPKYTFRHSSREKSAASPINSTLKTPFYCLEVILGTLSA
jgi:hypothetical protein